jgi:Phytanoyl-CoA dioxygenase (PhyH)
MTENVNRTPARTLLLAQTARKGPNLYSSIFRSRLLTSRANDMLNPREALKRNRRLFEMDDLEKEQVESLRNRGYAIAPGFFSKELMDRIYAKADAMFHNLQISRLDMPISIRPHGCGAMSYDDLAATEKTIELRDPLVHIPEALDIIFHESILKVVGHFLDCVPTTYRAAIVRDFPQNDPIHARDFRRDNQEPDSLRLFIDLVDVDDTRGPLVYIPGSNHFGMRSRRPRLWRELVLAGSNGRLSEQEVERIYPRRTWLTLWSERGSIMAIHRNGIHKEPSWPSVSCPDNKPRTAIRIDTRGYKLGLGSDVRENRMRKYNFDHMSELQRLFAHPVFVGDSEAISSRVE